MIGWAIALFAWTYVSGGIAVLLLTNIGKEEQIIHKLPGSLLVMAGWLPIVWLAFLLTAVDMARKPSTQQGE